MRAYAVVVCLLLILYHVRAAPRPCRNRRDVSEKKSDEKTENKAEEHKKSEDTQKKEKQKDKKQYVPFAPADPAVPAYNMGDAICEDSQPVQVIQIRDLSITNGVIKSSNIVQ